MQIIVLKWRCVCCFVLLHAFVSCILFVCIFASYCVFHGAADYLMFCCLFACLFSCSSTILDLSDCRIIFHDLFFVWLIDWSIDRLTGWVIGRFYLVLFFGSIWFDALRPFLVSHERCDPYEFLLVLRGFMELVSVMVRFRSSMPIRPRSPGYLKQK